MLRPASDALITVGPFVLDTANHRLLRDGIEVKLRPQAFHALCVLAQNGSHDVAYDRFIQEAWAGTSVSTHTLEVTIAEVKKALGEYGSWISRRPKLGYRLDIPESNELIRNGWHVWNQRTHEGFERALACFQQAAAKNGADFRAYEGLAQSYLMLGLYGFRPPYLMYGRFQEALRQALALTGWTAELRCAHACALHMFQRRFEESEREFVRALEENPDLVLTYVRLALLYCTLGRLDEALAVLFRGKEIDPLYPSVPGTEAFIRFCRREFDRAVECGRRAVELHPSVPLSRMFYAQPLEYSGRVELALAQYQAGHVLSPGDYSLRALEGACLARHGRSKKALLILREIQWIRKSAHVDAYHVAMLLEAVGKREEALRELARALEEGSTSLYKLDVDPNMDSLRQDPRFVCLRSQVFGASESAEKQPKTVSLRTATRLAG